MSFIQRFMQSASNCLVQRSLLGGPLKINVGLLNFQPCRGAKRRGYRMKKDAEKKKLKALKRQKEALQKKAGPLLRLEKSNIKIKDPRPDESRVIDGPFDNVYEMDLYKKILHPFHDVIDFHRETHHPTMLNEPNALVDAVIELDMRTKKKTKFVSPFSGVLLYPKIFEYEKGKKIVAICKKQTDQEAAIAAGAALVGGAEVVKLIKTKKLTSEDFDHIVCHTDMLLELAEVRAILKDHFPTKLKGNFGSDMAKLVSQFTTGVEFSCTRDQYFFEFGLLQAPIGKLTMNTEDLRDNMVYLLKMALAHKPNDTEGSFISRLLIQCLPSKEKILVNHHQLLEGDENAPKRVVKGEKASEKSATA